MKIKKKRKKYRKFRGDLALKKIARDIRQHDSAISRNSKMRFVRRKKTRKRKCVNGSKKDVKDGMWRARISTHLASLAGVYSIVKTGRLVPANTAQYRGPVEFCKQKKKRNRVTHCPHYIICACYRYVNVRVALHVVESACPRGERWERKKNTFSSLAAGYSIGVLQLSAFTPLSRRAIVLFLFSICTIR